MRLRVIATVLLCCGSLFVGEASAQAVEPGAILIRNLRLIDRDGKTEDVTVNVLIEDGILVLVTADEIPSGKADLVLDGGGGVLLGKLDLGSPPNFMVLDEDPRENFEALLDTATHAVLAVHEGMIVKNTLPRAVDTKPVRKKRGWIAYTPPPMALPLSYQDTSKWNRWEGKYISGIFLAAGVVDRMHWLHQDGASEEQVGDLTDYTGGEIRAFRLGSVGTLNFKRPWVYTIFGATHAFDKGFDSEEDPSFTILDYRLDIPISSRTGLSVGKQKEPISMERIMSMVFLPMQERSSVSDALLPARNVGIVVNGRGLDQRMTWAAGVFNDWFDAGQAFDESATQFIGRVTALPFITSDESNLLHLGLGLRYSNAKEGGQLRTEPEFNSSPDFVDTGWIDGASSMVYNLEVSWRKGRYWLAGEYIRGDVEAPDLGNPSFSGYHVHGSWSITGEMRTYNRRSGILDRQPVARSVYQGGKGAWELGARWSDLDLSDGGIDGGEMQIFSLGVNWWLTPTFHFSVNYRHIWLNRFGIEGTSGGINTRVLLALE